MNVVWSSLAQINIYVNTKATRAELIFILNTLKFCISAKHVHIS